MSWHNEQARARGRCRLQRRGGQVVAVDDYGNEVVVDDMMGAGVLELVGGGDDDVLGDDGDDDEDVLMGVDDDLSDMDVAAATDDDNLYGRSTERLRRKLDRINARIERIEAKPSPRGMFARARARSRERRLAKLRSKARKIQEKFSRAEEKRAARGRARTVSPAAAGAAGLAVGAGAGLAAGALISRQGAMGAQGAPMDLVDPARAHAMRVAQAQAGERFTATGAPFGSGRRMDIPFYADVANPNPRNAITVPAALISAATALRTEDVPYAWFEIVGFTSSTFGTDPAAAGIGLVQQYSIRGGTNLFLHEGPANAAQYDTDHDHMVGLRSYPKVRSPNFAQVEVAAAGDLNDIVVITANAVLDILWDDVYGAGFPGPYAG